ncbi:response regulator [Legionella clemsonensis]|uniref:Response regulator receiver domain protein n=1 Tax=Legionella clemsonensis TaxID=1867846 RepID=A0A222P1M0_9GAMM|nr:response regulator [Legionella clemsonensis]ASQ45740.1 Response regulator receiver domain protein [Legionella clemsonensis]
MKIVLVEDNPSLQKTMQMMLTKLSYSVKAFSAADDALAYFKEETSSYDLVILDGNLAPTFFLSADKAPKNGPDIAKELLRINRNIPIIAWTDDTEMLNRFQKVFDLYEKGILPTLKKPPTFLNIKEVLASFATTSNNLESSPRARAFTL